MTRPRLYHNWRTIIRKAWSIRLMLLAGALSGAEALVTIFPDQLHLSRHVLAVLVPLVIGAAFVARLVAQEDLPEADE